MHARTAPIVRLECPLALGHGCFSSVTVAPAPSHMSSMCAWKQPQYVRFCSSRLLAPAREPEDPGRSRAATFSPKRRDVENAHGAPYRKPADVTHVGW